MIMRECLLSVHVCKSRRMRRPVISYEVRINIGEKDNTQKAGKSHRAAAVGRAEVANRM